MRRTRLTYEHRDRGISVAEEAADLASELLGWDQERRSAELRAYEARCEAEDRAEGILDDVLTADRDVTFGQAVGLGLGEDEPEWVWLLHDDSSPRRGTLTRLLEGAKQADVVVPKLLQPKRRNYAGF